MTTIRIAFASLLALSALFAGSTHAATQHTPSHVAASHVIAGGDTGDVMSPPVCCF